MKLKITLMSVLAAVTLACNTGDKTSESEPTQERKVENVVTHYDNGMVEKKGMTINEKRHGRWESFYPTGLKWSEVEYRNGIKDGDAITYYPNGMMKYQGRYYNDERAGIWMFYDTTGVIIKRIDMDETDSNLDTLSTPLKKP